MVFSKASQPGFTMMEAMIAVASIGVISALVLPSVLYLTGTSTSLARTKNMASSIMSATALYEKNNPGITPSDALAIADDTKYTNKFTSGTAITSGPACSPTSPCYNFSDGSVLMANPWTPTASSTTYFTFRYDPDGTGSTPPVDFVVNFDTGRLTTSDIYKAETADAIAPSAHDPGYVTPWTQQ